MPKSFFLVRAVVTEHLRDKFDHWYSTDHLPKAIAIFKADKAWRFWSTIEPGVHYAVYRFADMAQLDAAMKSEGLKTLIAEFDAAFPHGVTRTRDIVTLAEERKG